METIYKNLEPLDITINDYCEAIAMTDMCEKENNFCWITSEALFTEVISLLKKRLGDKNTDTIFYGYPVHYTEQDIIAFMGDYTLTILYGTEKQIKCIKRIQERDIELLKRIEQADKYFGGKNREEHLVFDNGHECWNTYNKYGLLISHADKFNWDNLSIPTAIRHQKLAE